MKKFNDLDIYDARLDGFDTVDELAEALALYYPGIKNDDVVTIYIWKQPEDGPVCCAANDPYAGVKVEPWPIEPKLSNYDRHITWNKFIKFVCRLVCCMMIGCLYYL